MFPLLLPTPTLLFFACVHVCFYRQEVTTSQLSFLSLPLAAPVIYSPSCCSQTCCGSVCMFSSCAAADLLRKIKSFLFFKSLLELLEFRGGRGRCVFRLWARHEAEARRSEANAGRTLAWTFQEPHRRDGSYSKTHQEEMVTERNGEKRIGAF